MDTDTKFIIYTGVTFTIIGACISSLYFVIKEARSQEECILGLYSRGYDSYGDFKGEWIHINVNDKDIKQSLETCQHEVGHEIFARICQDNMTKCLEVSQ